MQFEELATSLRGDLVTPDSGGYDDTRAVYNAMIDKKPAAIAMCVDAADVQTCVNFARNSGVSLAIRSGGHNAGGLGSVDDGLVIDFSKMRGIRVDPKAKTVRIQPGCRWGDVDHATYPYGLAVPAGMISTTGCGGLTLGGGVGYLTRKYGLTIDNLLEADVVLADGSMVVASTEENADLFWALRGGGGNFGVVTSFLFRANPVHTVFGGPTLWELDRTEEIMKWYREFILQAPEELSGFFAFLTVPPVEAFPEHLHLHKMCGVVWCYSGDLDKAEEIFAPIRELEPDLYGVQEMPFPMLNSMFDGLYPTGHQWYWRADFFSEISDDSIVEHAKWGAKLPTRLSTMHLYPIDGAAHRVGETDTPWGYRDANWAGVIVGVDPDPAQADALRDWAVGYYDALHPHSSGGAYINFMMEEGQERVRASYRGNYDRLAEIKAKYDPNNLFRVNQNIQPKG
ncbi:MAG: FAD-dependent oxidoreductase [Acidobacteriota bacterium]